MKSKEWFYKQCLLRIQGFGPLTHLCWVVLQKGIGQSDSTRGHVTQAIGAVQKFLQAQPQWIEPIRASDPTKPFDINSHQHQQLLDAWLHWFESKGGPCNQRFGYDYDTLRGLLTGTLGGTCYGGGGGNDEFKRVLRLMAEFLHDEAY
jgi:hypothetical protein